MISCERCVRIIIGYLTYLFCQSFLLLQTEMRKKNAKKLRSSNFQEFDYCYYYYCCCYYHYFTKQDFSPIFVLQGFQILDFGFVCHTIRNNTERDTIDFCKVRRKINLRNILLQNFFFNHNGKKLTISRKMPQITNSSLKSYHPIVTLLKLVTIWRCSDFFYRSNPYFVPHRRGSCY